MRFKHIDHVVDRGVQLLNLENDSFLFGDVRYALCVLSDEYRFGLHVGTEQNMTEQVLSPSVHVRIFERYRDLSALRFGRPVPQP